MSRLVSSYFICLWEVVFCVLHAVINNHSQVRAVFVNIIRLTYMLLLREIISDGLILRYVINVDLWEQISPLTFPYWLLLLLTRSRDRSDWFFSENNDVPAITVERLHFPHPHGRKRGLWYMGFRTVTLAMSSKSACDTLLIIKFKLPQIALSCSPVSLFIPWNSTPLLLLANSIYILETFIPIIGVLSKNLFD